MMLDQEQLFQLTDGGNQDDPTIDRKRLHDPVKVRTVFLSDVHLGCPACEAQALVDFLRHLDAEIIYINGDFFDGLRKLPQSHMDVIQKLLRLTRKGTKIIFVPGNHDNFLRMFTFVFPDLPKKIVDALCHFAQGAQEATGLDTGFLSQIQRTARSGNLYIVRHIIHKAVDNKRYLIKHGDEHDPPWFQGLVNTAGSTLRDILHFIGMKELLKEHKTETNRRLPERALAFVRAQNEIVDRRREAHPDWNEEPSLNGTGCGHNHMPALITTQDGLTYFNSGDWVGSNTAVVEHADGHLQLVAWDKEKGIIPHPHDPNRSNLIREVVAFGIAAE